MEVAQKKDNNSNIRERADLEVLYRLCYRITSIRQQDFEFAEQMSTSLALKIVTQDNGIMNTDYMAIIDNRAYSIIHIDRDKEKNELYFYLEEARNLGNE